MNLDLSTTQRRVCMGAAAIIGVLILFQASEVGLEDTPWLVGVVMAAGLLGLAFAPAKKAESTATERGRNAAVEPVTAFRLAQEVVRGELMPVSDGMPDFGRGSMKAHFADHVRLQADKLAFMAAAVALERAHPGFRKGPRFDAFSLVGGTEFRKALRPAMEFHGKGDEALIQAAKEMGACIAALDLSMKNMVEQKPNAFAPIFRTIEKQLPFAETTKQNVSGIDNRLEAAYGPVFRKAALSAGQTQAR